MFKEYLKAPSPVYDHFNTTGHTTFDNLSIVGRENQNFPRTIKESIYIKVNGPPLNKNCFPMYFFEGEKYIGKQFSHITKCHLLQKVFKKFSCLLISSSTKAEEGTR